MSEEERWDHPLSLDDEYLKGAVMISEWCSFMVRETDLAFVHGAHLSAILTATSGIETYLRSEFSSKAKSNLVDLINDSPIDERLKEDLHTLRQREEKWGQFLALDLRGSGATIRLWLGL